MIPYAHQDVSENDVAAVAAVLRSDWLTQGPVTAGFEAAVADYCGVEHAVAVSSGTAALHLACRAIDLGPGDTLWTSPNSFVASANCARYCGADVDFIDIDGATYNLSLDALEDKLRRAQCKGNLPRVVVAVHFAGQSCDMEGMHQLARRYGFYLIEDASHAMGGTYRGGRIGGCRYSDMTVFSFHPVKLITTGEGGMVLTRNKDLYRRLLSLRGHGITRDEASMTEASHGPWYYQQLELGFNYRMSDLQAALGLSQLERLDEFVARRGALARRYDEALAGLPLDLPWQHPDTRPAWHLYVVHLHSGESRKTRREVFEALRAAGIGVNVHYIPIHTQPYYEALGFRESDFPVTEHYYAGALSLPLYPGLRETEQDYVIGRLRETLQ